MEPGGSNRGARTDLGGGFMIISPEKLAEEAEVMGFRPEAFYQVAQLLGRLEVIRSRPFLKER
jgi:hypothetical protein